MLVIDFNQFRLFMDMGGEFDGGVVAARVTDSGHEALGVPDIGNEVRYFLGLVVALEGEGHGFSTWLVWVDAGTE